MSAAEATQQKNQSQEPGPFASPVHVPIRREDVETYARHGRDPGLWKAVLNRADEGDIVLLNEGKEG